MSADHTPSRLVRMEADALLALAERLEGPMAGDFERAVERCSSAARRAGASW